MVNGCNSLKNISAVTTTGICTISETPFKYFYRHNMHFIVLNRAHLMTLTDTRSVFNSIVLHLETTLGPLIELR